MFSVIRKIWAISRFNLGKCNVIPPSMMCIFGNVGKSSQVLGKYRESLLENSKNRIESAEEYVISRNCCKRLGAFRRGSARFGAADRHRLLGGACFALKRVHLANSGMHGVEGGAV